MGREAADTTREGGPAAVRQQARAATSRTHHSLSRAGPRRGQTMQTHTGTGAHRALAGEDTHPDKMTWVHMQNPHLDMCKHTCTYTHTHTHPGHSDRQTDNTHICPHTPNRTLESRRDIQIDMHVYMHTHTLRPESLTDRQTDRRAYTHALWSLR